MVLAAGVVVLATLVAAGPLPVTHTSTTSGRTGSTMQARPAALGRAALQAPTAVCRVKDRRLSELSGLVGDGTGHVVVNDGSDDPDARRIFFLNARCKVTRTVPFPSLPRDTEDLARGPDGTLWVADIGDNGRSRSTIALWRLKPGARRPTLFRMSYPDGPHDAEALLIGADDVPVVVTKDPMTAGLYSPQGPLRAGRTTPLKRVGDFPIPGSGTSNPFGFPGRLVVTGGATSPDGRRAVLRTYADAFVFDAPDGDLVRAVSQTRPQSVALPDEPQGEAVAFTADGTSLLTVSEVTAQSTDGAALLRYPLPAASAPGSGSAPGAVGTNPSAAPDVPHGAASPGVPGAGTPGIPGTSGAPDTSAVPPAPGADGQPLADAGQSTSVARANGIPAGAIAAGGVLALAGTALGIFLARRRRTPPG